MITFNDDDNGYLAWIQENKSGYVINCSTTFMVNLSLHRAKCQTLSSRNRTTCTTNGHPKTCSNDREELVNWAKQSFGHRPLPCEICKP
jgi:hypothetical protein